MEQSKFLFIILVIFNVSNAQNKKLETVVLLNAEECISCIAHIDYLTKLNTDSIRLLSYDLSKKATEKIIKNSMGIEKHNFQIINNDSLFHYYLNAINIKSISYGGSQIILFDPQKKKPLMSMPLSQISSKFNVLSSFYPPKWEIDTLIKGDDLYFSNSTNLFFDSENKTFHVADRPMNFVLKITEKNDIKFDLNYTKGQDFDLKTLQDQYIRDKTIHDSVMANFDECYEDWILNSPIKSNRFAHISPGFSYINSSFFGRLSFSYLENCNADIRYQKMGLLLNITSENKKELYLNSNYSKQFHVEQLLQKVSPDTFIASISFANNNKGDLTYGLVALDQEKKEYTIFKYVNKFTKPELFTKWKLGWNYTNSFAENDSLLFFRFTPTFISMNTFKHHKMPMTDEYSDFTDVYNAKIDYVTYAIIVKNNLARVIYRENNKYYLALIGGKGLSSMIHKTDISDLFSNKKLKGYPIFTDWNHLVMIDKEDNLLKVTL